MSEPFRAPSSGPDDLIFMRITTKNQEALEKMFIGFLPMSGQVCELVCTECADGVLTFRLRVRGQA